MTTRTLLGARWCIYHEPRDWWLGAYFGEHHVYLCLIPTIVIRVRRRRVVTVNG